MSSVIDLCSSDSDYDDAAVRGSGGDGCDDGGGDGGRGSPSGSNGNSGANRASGDVQRNDRGSDDSRPHSRPCSSEGSRSSTPTTASSISPAPIQFGPQFVQGPLYDPFPPSFSGPFYPMFYPPSSVLPPINVPTIPTFQSVQSFPPFQHLPENENPFKRENNMRRRRAPEHDRLYSAMEKFFDEIGSDSDSDSSSDEDRASSVKNADNDDDDCVQIIEPPPKKERRGKSPNEEGRDDDNNDDGDDEEEDEEEDSGPIEISELKPQEDKYEYSKLPRVKPPKDLQSESCPICLESPMENPVGSKKCSHSFCYDCVYNWLSRYNKFCPTCRQKINKSDLVAYTDGKIDLIEID